MGLLRRFVHTCGQVPQHTQASGVPGILGADYWSRFDLTGDGCHVEAAEHDIAGVLNKIDGIADMLYAAFPERDLIEDAGLNMNSGASSSVGAPVQAAS